MTHALRSAFALMFAASALLMSSSQAQADSQGNIDVFQATHVNDPYSSCTTGALCNVASPWWGNTTYAISQRYGCTSSGYEPDTAPSWCPSYDTEWHQGIDIPMSTGTAIYSQVGGERQ